MERRLFAKSLGAILICALFGVCDAQDFKPRESSDPYFSTNDRTQSATPATRVAENNLQPRMPQMDRPGTTGQQLAPQTSSPLSSDFQIRPKQPASLSGNTSNDFRPRPSGTSIPRYNGLTPMPQGGRNQQAINNQFPNDQGSFRPRATSTTPNSFSPGSIKRAEPLVRNQPLFQEAQQETAPRFSQSEEFITPSNRGPATGQQRLPGEQIQPNSPQQQQQPQRNPQRDFVNISPKRTEMRTSVANSNSQDGDEFEPGRVVAIVGGKPIFVGDMLFEVNQLMDRVMPGAPAEVKDAQRGLVIKKMIPKFIDAKLLLIDTLEGLPAEANFETIIDSAGNDFDEKVLPVLIEKSNVKSAAELDAQLRAQGGSLRQFRYKWAEEQIIKYFTGQKLKIDTEVSHQEMLEYYQSNRQLYHQKAKVRWEELSIRFEKVPNRSEAERLIKKMGNEVVYGAAFDAVARKSSQGFTALEGGQHDWTSLGSLVYKDVEKALFSIPVNELSNVIPSQDGLHIVRVLERVEESYSPFLEAQVEIRSKIEDQKRGLAFEEHLKKLRQRIPFEIQLDDVELPPHLANQGTNLK